MKSHLGIRTTGSTVYIGFTTHASAGANVAPSTGFEAADIRIYKNGSATQRSSANGITMTSPFDSLTGAHVVAIDLSDNTDAGFYAAGGYYEVWLSPDETIDGQAVTQILASFDIADADPTAADVATAVRTELTTELGRIDAATSTRASQASLDTVDGMVDDILLDTAEIGAAGAGLTNIGTIATVTTLTNAPSDSSGVTTLLSRLSALRAGYLDNLSAGAVALAATFSGITSLAQWLGLIAGKQTGNSTARTELRATGAGSGTFDETTDSTEALRDRGDAAWTTATGFSTLDAAGVRSAVGLASADLDSQLAALPTAGENADAVWEEALADHSGTAGSTAEALSDAGAAGTPPTVSEIADAVWEETLADHSGTSGSTAAALNAAGSAGDPWNTALPGSYGAGSAGKILGDNLNATISSRATPAQVNTEADQALADVGLTTTVTGRIDAAISTRLATSGYTAPLDAAGTRTAVGLASANLDTQLGDLPTNAELATALGTADDAVLAAIAALNNLSSAGAQAAAAAALTAYSAATSANVSAVQTAVLAKLPAALSSNGNIKADIKEVNDVALQGTGVTGDGWRPA